MSIKIRLFFVLFFFLLFNNSFSQCCSAGSPVGVGTYAGLVAQKTLRVNTFFRYTFSKDYYEGSKKLETPILISESDFVFQGMLLSYGVFKKAAVDAEFGYFYRKSQNYINGTSLSGSGLSNGVALFKYGIFHSDSLGLDISLGAGIKYPFTKEVKYVDNVKLPIDIQPSTNAFGYAAQLFVRKTIKPYKSALYLVSRAEINDTNKLGYKFGSRIRTSLIYEHNFTAKIAMMLQLRHEQVAMDINKGKEFTHSGSKLIFISPLFLYSVGCKWHTSISADIPVYKYYNGAQLGNKFSLALTLTRDFSIKKRK